MSADPRHKSGALLDGPDRAIARSMMKAGRFTNDDLKKRQIGAAHCWIGTMPCKLNHRDLAQPVMRGMREAVGMPVVGKRLEQMGLLHTSTKTISGKLLGQEIASSLEPVGQRVMRPPENPIEPHGRLVILSGNAPPAGAVIKLSVQSKRVHHGPVRAFDGEEIVLDVIKAGESKPNDALLRYEGSCGGSGMWEMQWHTSIITTPQQ